MRRNRFGFEIGAGILCVALYGVFSFWYAGSGGGKLTQEEVDGYMATLEKQANIPEEDKQDLFERLRAWGESDDGGPVYMLNLMRTRKEPYLFPGAPQDFQGTAEEANRIYEDHAMPLLLERAGMPTVWGTAQGRNVIGGGPGLDNWSRLGFIRYPTRRTFFELVTDPEYLKFGDYKFMGMEFILVPTTAEYAIPDLRLVVGGALLIFFLGLGWLRSAVKLRRANS